MTLPDDRFTAIHRRSSSPPFSFTAQDRLPSPIPCSIRMKTFSRQQGVTAFLLETLRTYLPSCRFVFLSSAAVYGNPQQLPSPRRSPCHPISPYGYHKYICEMLCREYGSIYSIKSSVLRIFSAYGERLRKQVIFDLCRKFSDPALKTVEVYGTGDETRDFIHARDIAQAIDRIHAGEASGSI